MFPKLILVLLLCLSPQSWAQTNADDDFKLARNLFRDAGDYATAAGLFAEFIRNYPDKSAASRGSPDASACVPPERPVAT